MSTLSVTTVSTANGTTDLTLSTGNTTGSKVVFNSSNGMTFYANSTNTAAFIDASGFVTVANKLGVGNSQLGFDFGSLALIEIDANQNTYVQIVAQNANSGTNASTDLVLTNDTGNDTVNFLDIGINSSTYNQAAFNIGGAGDAYIYTSNGALSIGTAATGEDLIFHANGTTSAAEKMRVGANGTVVVSSNTFNLGTSARGASVGTNGYMYLPNGLKMNWGSVSAANTAAGTFATFNSAFGTTTLNIQVSHFSTTRTVPPLIVSANTTGANISSGLAATTGGTVYYVAIGY